ncbi:sigma 54-interacting transcriptional regulator [candidate division WOR-3 bacterium]|nr:sigma 54-interacting transcriptional regulator [candidate division WOR-3 bacterium]
MANKSGTGNADLPPGFVEVKKLGQGLDSDVWEVRHEASDERFALKIAKEFDPARRLEREFAVLERLDIPGIVKVDRFGKHQDREYFTMELIKGGSFTEYLIEHRNETSFSELFLEVLLKTALILAELHRQGIVHLDLKPGNLLVTEAGDPALLDFGFSEDYLLSPTAEATGATLDYAAPELFSTGQVTTAADIYSLGVMAYEAITGKRMLQGVSIQELISAKLNTPSGFGERGINLPSGIEGLVVSMLNPEKFLRPSAEEVACEIQWISKGMRADVKPRDSVPKLCFGGREKEIEDLEELIFREKRVVLLDGETGIGKTRLLRELRFRALARGRKVLFLEGRGAHLSLVDYLAASVGAKPETREDVETDQHRDKWHRYDNVFQTTRKKGFDAVIIDTPPNVSEDERGFLDYVAQGFDAKLGAIIAGSDIQTYPEGVRMKIIPLDKGKIAELVSRTFAGLKNTHSICDTLYSVADGNPRRMNELLELLYREGWLSYEQGWTYEPSKDEKGLKGKLDKWLQVRIERLDSDSRLALQFLSQAESAISCDIITDLLRKDSNLALSGVVNEGLVNSFLHGEIPHFESGNELIRSYVDSKLTEKDRKSLAGKLAQALERHCLESWGNDLEAWDITSLVQVASLSFKAGDTSAARAYLLESGKRLIVAGDYPKARELLEQVLESNPGLEEKKQALYRLGRIAVIENDPSLAEEYFSQVLPLTHGNPSDKADVLLRIGQAYQRIHELNKVDYFLDECEKSLAECPNAPPKLRCELVQRRGWNALFQGKWDQARVLFEKSLGIAPSEREKALAHNGLGTMFNLSGNPEKALYHAEKAVGLAEAAKDKGNKSIYILEMIHVLWVLGRTSEIDKWLKKALEICEDLKFPSLRAHVLGKTAFHLYTQGRYRKARDLVREAIEISSKLGEKMALESHRFYEAVYSTCLGDWKFAQETLLELWRKLPRTPDRIFAPFPTEIIRFWGLLYGRQGDFNVGRRMLKKAKRRAEVFNDKNKSLELEMDLCWLEIDAGDPVKARRLLKETKQRLKTQSNLSVDLRFEMLETELFLAEGKNESAAELSSRVLDRIQREAEDRFYAHSLYQTGRSLAATGNLKKGLEMLRESLKIYQTREQPYEQALALLAIAEATLEHQGRSDEAVRALDEARPIFERLGARHKLRRIKDLKAKHVLDAQPVLSQKYLEGLKQVSELINFHLGEEDFMTRLLTVALDLTGAERGMVFLADAGELHPVASRGIDKATAKDAQRISRTVIEKVKEGTASVYTKDTASDERFSRSQSIFLNDIRSLLCIPLRTTEGSLVGTVYLDSRKPGLFDAENTLYFEALGNLLAATIDRSVEFYRLQDELHLARQKDSLKMHGIVLGSSPAIKALYAQLERIAASDTNILLEGETGTGKGVFARMIHERSPRREREFCSINCGSVTESIFESELFGAKKGAYTGADHDRAGLLEAANGSTVFFDEITNTSPSMQAKLLEVIEERVIRRIGESRKRNVDLRFIFATNRNLKEEVAEGRFRKDLYFRISALTLKLPPLRERKEDIPQLIDFFLGRFSTDLKKPVVGIEKEAMDILVNAPWPGNVRELRNVIERLVLMSRGPRITKTLLKQHFFPVVTSTAESLKELGNVERKEFIRRVLIETGGKVPEAARRLGVSRSHLYRLIKFYGIKIG